MLEYIQLLVHDRIFPSDEKQRVAIVHRAHLIRCHKLAAYCLIVDAHGAVAPFCLSAGLHLDGLLAEHFTDVLVRALLVAAEVEHGIRVTQQALPLIFIKGLQSGNILQNDRRHDIAAAHGRLYLAKLVGQGHVAKLIHHQTDGDRQATLMQLVRAVVERLEGAGVEHSHKERKGAVVIGNYAKDSLFPLAQQMKLQLIMRCNAVDLRQDKS